MLFARVRGDNRVTTLCKSAGQFFIGGKVITSLRMGPDNKSIEVDGDRHYSVIEVKGYDSLTAAYDRLTKEDPSSSEMADVMAANSSLIFRE